MLRLLPRERRAQLGMVGVTIGAVLLTMGVHAGGKAERPVTQEDRLAWHSRLVDTPWPSVRGCFDATYPEVVWRETACVDPPSVHMSPNRVPAALPEVGDGKSLVAERPPGTDDITHAYGTFEEIDEEEANALTVRSSPSIGPTPVMADSYTLQLNTNRLKVRECAASPTPAMCEGWKQFIFANDGTGPRGSGSRPSTLYMQYWLLGFNPDASKPCPSGWAPVADEGEVHCSLKTPAKPMPYVPIKNIRHASFKLEAMTQTIAGIVVDIAAFNSGEPNDAAASVSSTGILHVLPGNPVPDRAGPGWTQVEFNVFGYGDGATAIFNKEANFNLRTTIVNGSPLKPKCQDYGYSREKNNLNFGRKPTAYPTSPAPALVVNQAQQAREPGSCGKSAVAIGDTHQYTFDGTFYDFQATGDFVEARAGSTFEVQTRKKSGAPTWPNASMNQSVGVRMGNTRLAVCAGTRLVVNGADTNLPSGESLLLPTGVTIDRVGNVYTFRDPSGNAVRTTAISGNVPYVDLGVGLGPDTPAARGLLGNHNGDPEYLEASDGTAMRVPLSFDDLYDVFGESWRVSPTASLLRFCETVAVANPAAPFSPEDLPAGVRQRAEEYCSTLPLHVSWVIPCQLDFAVLGPPGADGFLALQPAAKDGNPEPPPPSPSPTGGNSACRIAYTSTSSSASANFTGAVTITNTGNTPVNGWALTFSFTEGQRVTTGWNATVTQTNALVTARNVSYNGTIAPGASTSFGFAGTRGSGTNPPPVGWTLNGTACTT